MGALGLISVAFLVEAKFLLASMFCVGIAWASILSMPYAMLANSIPGNKMGFYMGIFNFFIAPTDRRISRPRHSNVSLPC